MSKKKPKNDLIEPKVKRLVKALNNLPGVITNSSCGGHEKPTIISQVASNEWYVDFNLLPHQMAWDSLGLIARASTDFFEEVTLKVWHDEVRIRFDLRGIDVTADDFAEVLEQGIKGLEQIVE